MKLFLLVACLFLARCIRGLDVTSNSQWTGGSIFEDSLTISNGATYTMNGMADIYFLGYTADIGCKLIVDQTQQGFYAAFQDLANSGTILIDSFDQTADVDFDGAFTNSETAQIYIGSLTSPYMGSFGDTFTNDGTIRFRALQRDNYGSIYFEYTNTQLGKMSLVNSVITFDGQITGSGCLSLYEESIAIFFSSDVVPPEYSINLASPDSSIVISNGIVNSPDPYATVTNFGSGNAIVFTATVNSFQYDATSGILQINADGVITAFSIGLGYQDCGFVIITDANGYSDSQSNAVAYIPPAPNPTTCVDDYWPNPISYTFTTDVTVDGQPTQLTGAVTISADGSTMTTGTTYFHPSLTPTKKKKRDFTTGGDGICPTSSEVESSLSSEVSSLEPSSTSDYSSSEPSSEVSSTPTESSFSSEASSSESETSSSIEPSSSGESSSSAVSSTIITATILDIFNWSINFI
ncbi:Hyphally regulated cell wall protein N-terminal-domain-containing protein [Scheffersomyces xylosifermentans]|uniref:Hyphally regulated cell wall protein N-terminal-domain-containing protein n=1 Tax=Scheffersomyces xylosifermentans TaxID=1304137 RepID=UPI00315D0ECF